MSELPTERGPEATQHSKSPTERVVLTNTVVHNEVCSQTFASKVPKQTRNVHYQDNILNNTLRGSGPRESKAVELAKDSSLFVDELNLRANEAANTTANFGVNLGHVVEALFLMFYNTYQMLDSCGNVVKTGSDRSFLVTVAWPTMKDIDYALVKEKDVEEMIKWCSSEIQDKWNNTNRTPFETAELLSKIRIVPDWRLKIVQFWEAKTVASQTQFDSLSDDDSKILLTLNFGDLTLLNCKASVSLYYPHVCQSRYVNAGLPVHALVFLTQGKQVTDEIVPSDCVLTTPAKLAADCARLKASEMLVMTESHLVTFAKKNLGAKIELIKQGNWERINKTCGNGTCFTGKTFKIKGKNNGSHAYYALVFQTPGGNLFYLDENNTKTYI